MAGNTKATALWDGADVYIAPEGTAGPQDTTTEWGEAWEAVGLLDGAEGFTEAREEESAEHYAWGGILYRRAKSKHKRTIKFVALEDNAATFRLRNPGSERTAEGGLRKAKVKVPTGYRFAIGFETRESAQGRVRRRAIKMAEVVEVGEIKDSEEEPTVYEFTVVLFPEADGTLWEEVEDDPDAEPAAE